MDGLGLQSVFEVCDERNKWILRYAELVADRNA